MTEAAEQDQQDFVCVIFPVKKDFSSADKIIWENLFLRILELITQKIEDVKIASHSVPVRMGKMGKR